MVTESGDPTPELGQKVAEPHRRGRRLASRLAGISGTSAVIFGVLCLLVLSFVGSKSAVTSTVRLALNDGDVNHAIAEEIVVKMEEGGDNDQKVVLRTSHDVVVDAVAEILKEDNLREAAANDAGTIYGVYLEGKSSATINLQIFADAAFKAMRLSDPSIPSQATPHFDPLLVERDSDSPDLAGIRKWVLLVPWILILGGILLLFLSWSLSVGGKWLWCRRLGIRIFINGAVLIAAAYLSRNSSINEDSSGRIAKALLSFTADRMILWSIVIAAVGAIVALVGGLLHRQVTSTRIASA